MIESWEMFKHNDGTYVHVRWDNGNGFFTNIYMVGPSPTVIEIRNSEVHQYQLNFEEMTVISEEDYNEQKTAKQNEKSSG